MTYEDHPISVTEAKGQREADASKWMPRDALIHVLRKIDAGELKPDALIVLFREEDGDDFTTNWSASSPNSITTLGLLARAMHLLQEAMD